MRARAGLGVTIQKARHEFHCTQRKLPSQIIVALEGRWEFNPFRVDERFVPVSQGSLLYQMDLHTDHEQKIRKWLEIKHAVFCSWKARSSQPWAE